MKRIYLIDQRDSFVYNLVQLLRESCGAAVMVVPETRLGEEGCLRDASGLLLSPGPGVVEEHEATLALLRHLRTERSPLPVLGVCMGHQEMGVLCGMELYPLPHPQHGVESQVIWCDGSHGPMRVGRYHSWALRETEQSRSQVEVAATTEDGTVMAIRHRQLPWIGVQFHPESILTPDGAMLLRAWTDSCL
jgi:anthranilate synthase/aminodeoxychorismate synthase-like glutamine amidotransferase